MRKELISQRITTNIRQKTTRNSISPNTISDILEDILNAQPEHTSKSITVTADDIEACVTCDAETLEEQIAQYLNTLNYDDINVNGEVWVNYDDLVVIYVPFTTYSKGRPSPVTFAHGGENALPVIGDTIYIDVTTMGLPTGEPSNYQLYHVVVAGNSKATYSIEIEPTLGTFIHLDETTSIVTGITSNYTLIENSNLRGDYYHNGGNGDPQVGDIIYYQQNGEGGPSFFPINSVQTDIPYVSIGDGPVLVIGIGGEILSELAPTYKGFNINQNTTELLLHTNSASYPEIGDTIYIYDRATESVITDSSRLSNIAPILTTTENNVNYNYGYDILSVITSKSVPSPSV